jgi:hypothetical protein
MAETLDRIHYRLGTGALPGFLNGPRAFCSPAGQAIVTVASRHPPGACPAFGQVTGPEPHIAGWHARMKQRDDRGSWPIRQP